MFRYRLHSPDGDDLGEATYAMMIKPGEEILVGNGRRLRVLHAVPFDEEDESPFVGMLKGRGRLERLGRCAQRFVVGRVRLTVPQAAQFGLKLALGEKALRVQISQAALALRVSWFRSAHQSEDLSGKKKRASVGTHTASSKR